MKDAVVKIIGFLLIGAFVIGCWYVFGVGFNHLAERREPVKPPAIYIFPVVEHANCNEMYVNGEIPETCYLVGWITSNGVYHAAHAYSPDSVDDAILALKGNGYDRMAD